MGKPFSLPSREGRVAPELDYRVRDMEVTHWRVFFFYAILLSVSIRSE